MTRRSSAGQDEKPVPADELGRQRAQERARKATEHGEPGDAGVEVSRAEEATGAGERGRDHGRERGCHRQQTGHAQDGQDGGGERRAAGAEHAEHEANAEAGQDVLDEVHVSTIPIGVQVAYPLG